MIVTESSAKEKWCPFVRVAFPAGNSACNKISPALDKIVKDAGIDSEKTYYKEEKAACNCIASGCMQWQWFDPAPPLKSTSIPRNGWEANYLNSGAAERDCNARRGFCGMSPEHKSSAI